MCALILLTLFGVVLFGIVSTVGHILLWAFVLAIVVGAMNKRN